MTQSHRPYIRRAGLGNSRWFGGHLFSFLARGAETAGQFALMELIEAPGQEPPAHTHSIDDEAFYILEGAVEFRVGQETAIAGKGDFVHLPVGIEHGFRVLGPKARVLLFSVPAGIDDVFTELSEPADHLDLRADPPPFDVPRFLAAFGKKGLTFRPPDAPPPVTRNNPALAIRPAIGRSRWYLGHFFTPLLTGGLTNGRLSVSEFLARRGMEPPPHLHHREDEAFYLLDGEVSFRCGDEVFDARAGDFVYLPRGIPHGFVIKTDTVRALLVVAPSQFENFFLELSKPAEALMLPPPGAVPGEPAQMTEIAAKYGIEFVRW